MVLVFHSSETHTMVMKRERKGYRENTPMIHFLQGGPNSYLSPPPNNSIVELIHQKVIHSLGRALKIQ